MPDPLGCVSPGETTVTQERLQPPHEGQTHLGEHNVLSTLSGRYADTTIFKKVIFSRY